MRCGGAIGSAALSLVHVRDMGATIRPLANHSSTAFLYTLISSRTVAGARVLVPDMNITFYINALIITQHSSTSNKTLVKLLHPDFEFWQW